MKPVTAASQLATFIARFTPEMAKTIRACRLRTVIKARAVKRLSRRPAKNRHK